jgi:hypothetical protein
MWEYGTTDEVRALWMIQYKLKELWKHTKRKITTKEYNGDIEWILMYDWELHTKGLIPIYNVIRYL